MKKGDIKIIKGIFEKTQHLQFAPKIKAGFPSPADDYTHESIDFNRDLIRHPEATFYGRVDGDSMIEAGTATSLSSTDLSTPRTATSSWLSWMESLRSNISISAIRSRDI